MAQINARDWIFQVSPDPDAGSPVWNSVSGIVSFTLSQSDGEGSTDTTTFDSDGFEESQAMQRGAALTLEGRRIPNDPGQDAADDAAQLVGEASLVGCRFRHTSETDWTAWDCWVSKGDLGGGNNDKTTWGATFKRSGAATVVPVA